MPSKISLQIAEAGTLLHTFVVYSSSFFLPHRYPAVILRAGAVCTLHLHPWKAFKLWFNQCLVFKQIYLQLATSRVKGYRKNNPLVLSCEVMDWGLNFCCCRWKTQFVTTGISAEDVKVSQKCLEVTLALKEELDVQLTPTDRQSILEWECFLFY